MQALTGRGMLWVRRLWDDPGNRIMLFVLSLAFLARLLAIFLFPSLHYSDENFQTFEQAHRMAFGYGMVIWEFRAGLRSPILPFIFAAIFGAVEPVFGGPEAYIYAARIALALFSLIAVAAVVRMGLRTSRVHAVLAGVAAATWHEIVYFSHRPFSEAVATTTLVVALALASSPDNMLVRRRLFAIGIWLGAAVMFRLQLAPAVLVIALLVGRLEIRERWWPMILGGLIPVLVFGAADWIYWGSPFHSTIVNIRKQLIEDVSSQFGVSPPGFYVRTMSAYWGNTGWPLLLALIVLRLRSSLMWIAAAAVIIACHSMIPHKEYRFIYPAIACLAIVAGMGSADVVQLLRRYVRPLPGIAIVLAVAAAWIWMSAIRPYQTTMARQWFKYRALVEATFAIARKPELCGILTPNFYWFEGGGYAYLHRRVPIYGGQVTELPKSHEPYNVIVLNRSSVPKYEGAFSVQQCFTQREYEDVFKQRRREDVCIMTRPGVCRHQPGLPRSDIDHNVH